jgi:hypothetical protein
MGFTTEAVLGPPPLTPEQLFVQMQRLRAYAVNKKLDMTDAFDEYAGERVAADPLSAHHA